jgi:hypothetical protein
MEIRGNPRQHNTLRNAYSKGNMTRQGNVGKLTILAALRLWIRRSVVGVHQLYQNKRVSGPETWVTERT